METTSRYNSFNLIHKGLRSMVYATANKIQQTDFTSVQEGGELIEEILAVLALFESHAHGEDKNFNEPLERHNKEVSALFEKEHEEDHRLSNVITSIIADWQASTDAEGRLKNGRLLFYAFNEFVAFNLYHMNKEEILLNAELWKVYSDDQIREIEQRIVQAISPQKMGQYAKWMFRGNCSADIIHWLGGVKQHAPAEVYQALRSIAQQELDPQKFYSITSALEETVAERV